MTENIKEQAALFEALHKFREQLRQPAKDGDNTFFKSGYVTLEGVIEAIDNAIKDTGLAYYQQTSSDEKGRVYVETIVTHKDGGFIKSKPMSLPPKKNDAQGQGSSITYARRYQLAAMFGIASDKDDDGNAAVDNGNKTRNNRYQRKNNGNRNNYTQHQSNPNQGAPTPQISQSLKNKYNGMLNRLNEIYPEAERAAIEGSIKRIAFNNKQYQMKNNSDYQKAVEAARDKLGEEGYVEETTLDGQGQPA